jgi:eukaryotic-like serine/threonine-protein kinase
MPAGPDDDTLPAIETSYASLTQAPGWASPPTAIVSSNTALASGARYEEGVTLGMGGMGHVVLARDARIGRNVAIKSLRTDRNLSPEDRQRFFREAQVQGQLEHPSIVPVYDIELRADGTTFFTMRRVVGRTLQDILDGMRVRSERRTQRELLQGFATVCLTLEYAHSRGVIHRDLKPANIMFGDFGEVYVLDWGLARVIGSADSVDLPAAPRISTPGAMMGTPLYMAPEQMRDPEVGAAADVFSLGAILFELLTLERLRDPKAMFAPVDARASTRAPERPVAPELESTCLRATADREAERFASARELHDAIARYLDGDREREQRLALAGVHSTRARQALER